MKAWGGALASVGTHGATVEQIARPNGSCGRTRRPKNDPLR